MTMTSVHAHNDPLCELGTTVAKTTVETCLCRLDKSCQRHWASGEAGYARILMRKHATQTFKICCSLHEPMRDILNTLPLLQHLGLGGHSWGILLEAIYPYCLATIARKAQPKLSKLIPEHYQERLPPM